MKLSAFIKNDGACTHYRITSPLTMLGLKERIPVKIIDKNNLEDIEEALEADVIIVHGVAHHTILDTLKSVQEYGKKVVVDYDDNIFKISPLSRHYKEHGLENVQIEMDGKVMPIWVDGKNFSIAENQKRVDDFKFALEMADAVTVTTPILADAYKEYNDNVLVMPNCIDTNIWQALPLKPHKEIRLVWFGGSSHYEDWFLLKDAIPAIMKKHPQVKLVLMGCKWDATLKGIPKDRIEYHTWVPTPAYPYKAAILNPDIAVIPLRDNEFNRCKSAIKWIEMASLGVPSVASHVSPYKEIATEDNGVFVDNEVDSWIRGISLLVEDSVLRAKIGGEAKKTIERDFDINKEYTRWSKAYKELAA